LAAFGFHKIKEENVRQEREREREKKAIMDAVSWPVPVHHGEQMGTWTLSKED
jgi:hypothetical protein